mgnify:CR=1 FL=1
MQISPPVSVLFFKNSRCHQIRSKSSETETKDMENDIYNYLLTKIKKYIPVLVSTLTFVAKLQSWMNQF